MNQSQAVQQIGTDISELAHRIGNLPNLNTTAKTNLVSALNELKAGIDNAGTSNVTINDASTSTTEVLSASKTIELISQAKADLTNGASSALDTLAELAAAINNDPSFATTIVNQLNNRLRFDAPQTLTTAQQQQAAQNLGIDDPTIDYFATYTTARGTI